MVSIGAIAAELIKLKPTLQERFQVEKIGYFGSFSRGEITEKSDIDILVEFSEPIGWDFFRLEAYLEDKFGRQIDPVTKKGLRKSLSEKILKEVIYI